MQPPKTGSEKLIFFVCGLISEIEAQNINVQRVIYLTFFSDKLQSLEAAVINAE